MCVCVTYHYHIYSNSNQILPIESYLYTGIMPVSLSVYLSIFSIHNPPKKKASCYQEFNFDSTVPRVWDPHGSRSKILLAGQLVNFDTHIPICLELILVLEKVGSYAAAISASKLPRNLW